MNQAPNPAIGETTASTVAARSTRYELLDSIAAGGMAHVYLGRVQSSVHGAALPSDPAPVAIKLLHPHLAQDPEVVALFLDEARVATRIRHPNVVHVRDVDMVGEDLVIIMEYVEGLPLSGVLKKLRARKEKMSLSAIVRVMIEVLRGLHAAHELRSEDGLPMDIVHRDVSPHNVMVGADGVSRVTDFGIATSVGRLAQTRTGGGVRGKLQYLAPEQIHRKTPDRRVDVWAAGLVLWECLTGRRLFSGGTEAESIADTLRAPIRPPSMLRTDVPLGLDDICLRALERDPARRFASAAEFADALERDAEVEVGTAEEVGALICELDGETFQRRREVLERGPTAPVTLPPRFAFSAAAPAPPLSAPPPALVSYPPPPPLSAPASVPQPAPQRSNLFALVMVAAVSLVIGGVAVRFAGQRSRPPQTETPLTSERSAIATSPAVTALQASPAAATDGPDAGTVLELPAATARPGGVAAKKRPPAPKGSSSSGRPFMPADL